jgi:hypothetical protein
MKNPFKIFGFVASLVCLLLALPRTSYAIEGYETSMSFLENPFTEHGGEPGEGEAVICCTSTTRRNCQSPRGDSFIPARRIVVLAPGTGRVSADIFNGPDCTDYVQTVTGTNNFPESNLWEVDIDFTPDLAIGQQISLKWTEGTCEQLPCVNYTLGSDPGGCWDDY